MKTIAIKIGRANADQLANTVRGLLFQTAQGSTEAREAALEVADALAQEFTSCSSLEEMMEVEVDSKKLIGDDVNPRAAVLAEIFDYAMNNRAVR